MTGCHLGICTHQSGLAFTPERRLDTAAINQVASIGLGQRGRVQAAYSMYVYLSLCEADPPDEIRRRDSQQALAGTFVVLVCKPRYLPVHLS